MTRDSEDAFERHMAVLLAILEEVRGRTAKPRCARTLRYNTLET